MSETVKDYPPYLDYPKPRKKQTNADKIRAMTDEELTKIICCQDSRHGDECFNTPCVECLLDWLKQEVNENGA